MTLLFSESDGILMAQPVSFLILVTVIHYFKKNEKIENMQNAKCAFIFNTG